MFTGWVTAMFTLQLNVYTVAISSVNKIVINEWLRLNNSGFLIRRLKAVDDEIKQDANNLHLKKEWHEINDQILKCEIDLVLEVKMKLTQDE